MARLDLRPRPALQPEYCKGCLRCVDACPKDCITQAGDLNATTGVRPVVLHLDDCNGCQLCIQACPEPYGLVPQKAPGETASGAKAPTAAHDPGEFELEDPTHLFGAKTSTLPAPVDLPGLALALPTTEPLMLKGTYAAALGALLAGCRHVFGYPITPSTEGAELMAKVLPHLGGSFVQAVSEVAAINMMYGCAGAGLPCMTFTSSPGFSLMLEGISYMIGAELPGVVMNVMRGGPGLGNIAPEQADIKLMTRGLGHGNTHAIVLAPSTPQEMLDLSRLAFELAFAYRNPVIIAADGYLGQMAGVVRLPATLTRPGLPAWAVWGDRAHRMNLVCSIQLSDTDLEAHNHHLNDKYADITKKEQRAETWLCDDAEVLLVACNTPARMAKGAVMDLREAGVAAGLVRPITLWPFPIDEMRAILTKRPRARVVVVEASPGQLEDELRLALSHAGLAPPPIQSVRRMGGVLPQRGEIVAAVLAGQDVAASGGVA
ncbi:MAG: 3-methyl-2-oxobutanoate dehydrogenase subunit VorB [Deltaproteobacteria bacterium]|nr:3-methyl-2-oxobutanoate dehydrogenase subunit VorB [Deltaproteobacteria bacterium]